MAGIFDFMKDLAVDMGTQMFGIHTLKNFITQTTAQQTPLQGPVEAKGKTAEGKNVDVKFGGMFNLSDEGAYAYIMALLETSQDNGDRRLAYLVSKNVNEELHFEDQKRRFRVVFGHLAQIEYTKTTGTEVAPIKAVKINLAVECLKNFIKYTPEERLEVYRAMGIMESEIHRKLKSTQAWVKENEQKVVGALQKINATIAGPEPYEGLWSEMRKTLFGSFRKK